MRSALREATARTRYKGQMSAFADLPIETPRLRLRPALEADAQALFEIFADPQVMRYWSSAPWTDIAPAQQRIARDLADLQTGASLQLMIERREDARLLGQCSLHHIVADCRRADIGYILAASAWGQGYMNEALTALLRHGFGPALNLNRIEGDVDPRNGPSARVLERLGFRQEGLLRERWIVAGEVQDSAIYGLLRSESPLAG